MALQESEKIIIFGYSGMDTHLNNLIESHLADKVLQIIEWNGNVDEHIRKNFWKTQFHCEKLDLIQKENILEFHDWE